MINGFFGDCGSGQLGILHPLPVPVLEVIDAKIRKREELLLTSDPFWGLEFARAFVENFKCGRASCKTLARGAETGAVDWPDARDQAVDFGARGEP